MDDKITTILMTTDTVGGVWNYSLELCSALEPHGVQIHLAAMGKWPSQSQEDQVAALENVLLYKSNYKLEWMQDPWEDIVQAGKWLNSIYQTQQPDLIHFNNYAHLGKQWNCPTLTVFHSCVQTWWRAVKGTSAPARWDKYLEAVRHSLNSSDVVVAPTYAIMEKAIAAHKISSRTKVIYNGKKQGTLQPLEKEPFILCAGRIWDEAKNLQSLVGIADNLTWPIYVIGNNIHPDTGKAVALQNVQFLGELSREETQQWMKRAAVFISPTKYEPFGLAILEAAAAGCVLILNKLFTLRELWEESAIFFDPEDKKEASKIISRVIEDTTLRRAAARGAAIRAKNFSSEKMALEYNRLYGELLQARAAVHQAITPAL